jgi:hypothetical protein
MAERTRYSLKTLEEIGLELTDDVQQRQREWPLAGKRPARPYGGNFNEALRAFNVMFLPGKYPDE